MRPFLALLKKEEMALFTSPIAYVVMSVFLVIMGYTFTLTLFLTHVPTLVHLFLQIYVLFLLTVPIITMRLVAEERRLRTLEILLTSPLSEVSIVLAKFLASVSLIVVMLLLSYTYALALAVLGAPDWGPIYSGYIGLLLLGAALVAVGLMTSSMVSNQVIAALLSLSIFLVLWIIDYLGWLLPDPFNALFVNLSLLVHFRPFATGSLFLSDAGYFPQRDTAWPVRQRPCAGMALRRTLSCDRAEPGLRPRSLSWRSSSPWWAVSASRTRGSPTPSISLRGARRCSCCSRSACGCRCTCAADLRRSRLPASLSPPPGSDCLPISRSIGTTRIST